MKSLGIRIVGNAGQGIVLAGKILAVAAIYEGMNSTQTQSYGAAPRIGQVVSEVIISEEEITYFRVLNPHVLIILSPAPVKNHLREIKPGGVYICGESILMRNPELFSKGIESYCYPVEEMSHRVCGSPKASNMIALGILTGITKIVSTESVEAAIRDCVPQTARDFNIRCFQSGLKSAGFKDIESRI